MTSVMLATYPEVFAGGAIIAGLPYGAATNMQQAFETMYQCPPRAARAWGELVRKASRHKGPWPRVSVWHGGADATVIPPNAAEIIKQWSDVHGLPVQPSFEAMVDGYPRQVWVNAAGDELIECTLSPAWRMEHHSPREPQMISAELLDHFSSKSGFPLRTTSPGFLVLRPTAGLRNPRGDRSGPACRKCWMGRRAQKRQRSRSTAKCWSRTSGQARSIHPSISVRSSPTH